MIVLLAVAVAALLPGIASAAGSSGTARAASVRAEVARTAGHVAALRVVVQGACKAGTTKRCKLSRAKLAAATAKAKKARAKLHRVVRTSSDSKSKPAKKNKAKKKTSTKQAAKPAGSTPSVAAGASASPATTTPAAAQGSPPAAPAAPAPSSSAPAGSSASSAGSIAFQPGIVSGSTLELDVPAASKLGAKQVRIEFPIGMPASGFVAVVRAYADAGIRILPLAGFPGRIPTVADARNLAGWAAAYGPGGSFWANRTDGDRLAIRNIEFGNETSMGYQYGDNAGDPSYVARARSYALRLRDARQAIDAAGSSVGLLAQVDDWTGNWVDSMYAAVPDFDRYVAGWTTHPYGDGWRGTVASAIAHVKAHGAPASIPFDVTEWGLASDNGRCLSDNYGLNPCMDYSLAAATTASTVSQMRAAFGGRLRTFMLYQVRDQADPGTSSDRERYFGALQHDLRDKGPYTTAVRSLLAG